MRNVDIPEDVTIRRSAPADAEAFRSALDVVARERRWLGFLEAPSLEEVVLFLTRSRPIQFLAERDSRVVGWCDITPRDREGFRHSGTLGMGILPGFRGMGIGKALLVHAVDAALDAGLTRIELEVFASNDTAIRLYTWAGFNEEGRKRRARILDGVEEDTLLMALLSPGRG